MTWLNWVIPAVLGLIVGLVIYFLVQWELWKAALIGVLVLAVALLVSWAFFSPHAPAVAPKTTEAPPAAAAPSQPEPRVEIDYEKLARELNKLQPTPASIVVPPTPMPSSPSGLTCFDFAIPRDGQSSDPATKAWSNASYLLIAQKTSVYANEARWVESPAGSGKWVPDHMVEVNIPWSLTLRKVDLQKSKTHPADWYNDLLKTMRICDDPSAWVVVLFGSDGADLPNDWALQVAPNGSYQFWPKAGHQFDSQISTAEEFYLP
jgi:hypothetical protein